MMDGVTGMFNTLTIKSINEQKNGMVVVKIQNVDDFYEQNFNFNSMEHFENWFRKYVI
jgi:putative repE